VGEALALGDASVAWNVTNLAAHHWMLAMFPKAVQDAVWQHDRDALIASSFIFPAGNAQKTIDGYLLSGRWPFCSGVNSSSWNMLAGTVVAPDQKSKELRFFLVPATDYEIIDT
jgi:3-hydroxy-9,10-secoandrosta-1,3,5(10)-triene-9,17-dione monooxygenase